MNLSFPPPEQDLPVTPNITTSPAPAPDVSVWPDMSPPTSYNRVPYHRSRNGSERISSSRYPQYQYPSPTDSNSSRGRGGHDVDPMYVHQGQYGYPGATTGVTPPSNPAGANIDSLEFSSTFSMIRSHKYPGLHFLLARDSAQANGFEVDMRNNPQRSIREEILENFGALWISRDRPVHVRIVSPDFPWVIDIEADEAAIGVERGVTCNDVWNHIYRALLEPIQDVDWAYLNDIAMVHPNSDARTRLDHLVGVARQQTARDEPISLLRLDWLVGKTVFTGVEKDEGYRLSVRRLAPGGDRVTETWVAHFIEHS